MLSQIYIKKYLYFYNILIEPDKGFNVFTGETGAGKSLIVDAVEFVLGKKGSWEEGTSVELVFEDVFNPFSEEGALILRREVKKGKSSYFINGRRATQKAVVEASHNILEIQTQHYQQNLFKESFYREILDDFSQLYPLLKELKEIYTEYISLKKKRDEILTKQSERLREIDILKFQLRELEEADIKVGEKEELENKYRYLSKIKDIRETVYQCGYILSEGENSVIDTLKSIIKLFSKIKDFSPELQEIYRNLEEGRIFLEEANYQISGIDLNISEEELFHIEERLNLFNKLELKYNTDEEGLLKLIDEFRANIEKLEKLEYILPEIEEKITKLEKRQKEIANKISYIRKEKAKILEKIIEKHLKELGLPEARFKIVVEDKGKIDRYGKDKIVFMFSANKGFETKPISEVASGGEVSRISLVLKLISGKASDCLIFDEIDTGIGGKTAVLLGKKLKELSKKSQILLITHLPQIAVFADKHFYIEKDFSKEKTTGIVINLDYKLRTEELARMLTGKKDENSLKLAENLLKEYK